ncbi:MAG: ribulose-phosphate 3-epimerase [Dysgonamonadaceae bacterium]|jgi:ribulose-phosphate 3-epimerase|nr:ribulose-phosphate 3-epimerase [Dysgonamonadaceae bacterium]
MSFLIAPSILSADFLHLERDIEMLNNSEADWLHLDVMDGVFVPNISIGIPTISQVTGISKKPVDAHLMLIDPQRYISIFRDLGISTLTVHYEACNHLHRVVSEIRLAGMSPGVAINPHTPVELLADILEEVDLVIIMAVNPGFGGQGFILHTLDKVYRLKRMIDLRGLKTLIEVDGGITLGNVGMIAESGADVLVAGNAVFGADNPAEMIRKFKAINSGRTKK